ncbi:hypothetical protein GCM10025864_14870 [Luteimicrobium album]|uniref:Uncharacterized protein n=1 Tax=Luteimicrobium album TaxID=1054550 RepID=A0ABQ6HZ00_9MICO|nr:hypothetical protein GCM10025864_14870 [Luteimicrobium album]
MSPDDDRDDGTDDRPARDPALPVHEVAADLTPAHEVAREALARAKQAARAKGLRPGVVRRPLTADGPQRVHNPGGRDPQLVADVLANLLKARGWVEGVSVGGVVGRWPEVVGDAVAAHCVPESFDDKVLVVRADSTAWATQVELLVPRLLEALAREVGEGVVEQVRVLGPGARASAADAGPCRAVGRATPGVESRVEVVEIAVDKGLVPGVSSDSQVDSVLYRRAWVTTSAADIGLVIGRPECHEHDRW